MNNSAIHVCMASDSAYFRGLLTTTYSLLSHSKKANNIVIHIIDGGITNTQKNLLKSALKKFNATFDFIQIDQKIFNGLATWHGSGKMAYARLLTPELLPEISHIIYTDIDILWLTDVAELWKLRSNKFSLQYVKDTTRPFWHNSDEDKWLKEHSLNINRDKYFCSGILLLNLAKFRENKIHSSALEILYATNGTATFRDQTALNIIFANRNDMGELSSKWQTMTSDKISLSNNLDVVLHYAGDCPWNSLCNTNHILSDLHILWHRTYAQIVGISLWKSLRADNSPLMIIISRLLYLAICHCKPFKQLLRCYLKARNKDPSFLDSIFRTKIN